MENENRQYAKRILLHYFDQIYRRTGKPLEWDCQQEIEGIVDSIIDAAVAEVKSGSQQSDT